MKTEKKITAVPRLISSLCILLVMVIFVLSGFIQQVYAFAGGDGSPGNPYQIASWSDLDDMRNNLTASYILTTDLDQDSPGYATYASASANSNNGWLPVGDSSTRFQGTFDGNNHTIADLNIIRSGTGYIGLFGATNGSATISDVVIEDAVITGASQVGAVIGQNQGTVSGVFVTNPTVNATSNAGGIVGQNSGTIILSSTRGGTVTSSGAWGGGIVGIHAGGLISRSWSSASVAANNDAGGLAGHAGSGAITNSYSTGNVTSYNSASENSFGGLAGVTGGITNAYASGDVTIPGTGVNSGGLYGEGGGTVANTFATGTVTAPAPFGGYAGNNGSSNSNSYSVHGTPVGVGNTAGITDVADDSVFMGVDHTHPVYSSWDFDTIWEAHEDGLPTLRGNVEAIPPEVSSFTPADNATNIAINANLEIEFDKSIESGDGNIVLYQSSDDSVVETFPTNGSNVDITDSTVTVNPSNNLLYSTAYYVRVDADAIKEVGSENNYFAGISDETTWNFTTMGPDNDNDGISTESEDAGPNGGDGNNDGTADSEQAFVASLPNNIIGGGAYMTIEIDNEDCTELTEVSVVSKSSLGTDNGYDYPVGLLDFGVICSGNGDSTEVTIYYDKVYDTSSWTPRKYLGGEFQNLTGATFGTAMIGSTEVTTMTYTLTDGGPLDADGVANGQIQDPAGPGEVLASATDTDDEDSLVNTGTPIIFNLIFGVSLILIALLLAFQRKQEHETASISSDK